MATGDYHHTALAVGRAAGMIAPQGQVVIIQKESETRTPGVRSKEFALRVADKPSPQTGSSRQMLQAVSSSADLCSSQDGGYQGLTFQNMNSGSPAMHDALHLLTAAAQVCVYSVLGYIQVTVCCPLECLLHAMSETSPLGRNAFTAINFLT